jgi:hypothetical protein
MVRRLVILFAAVSLALTGAGTTKAQEAVHLNDVIDLDASFVFPELSAACGFDVTVTVSGAVDVTLIYNDAGLVVREIDTAGGGQQTLSSAYASFSFPLALTGIYTYPGGATLGSTVNFELAGLFGHVPGFTPSAGVDIVGNGIVDDFSPEGIPHVDNTTANVVSHGPRTEEIFNAVCAALSPA